MLLKTITTIAVALLATSAVAAPHKGNKGPKVPKVPKKPSSVPFKHIAPMRNSNDNVLKDGLSCQGLPTTGDISNPSNGQVITGNVNIYYIFYGSWTQAQKDILTTFGKNIGGSPYLTTVTGYGASGKATYVNSTDDNYSLGKTLSDDDLPKILQTAVNNGLPVDPNAVYFINTAADVTESGGFCSQYCGFHTNTQIGGKNLFYAFIGNPETCLTGCAPCNTKSSPNGDLGVDAMVSVIAHELVEAITDPMGDAWRDAKGNENADKCAYTYGKTSTDSDGSVYNVELGGLKYLIQQNWLADTQSCALSAK